MPRSEQEYERELLQRRYDALRRLLNESGFGDKNAIDVVEAEIARHLEVAFALLRLKVRSEQTCT